MAEEFFDLPNAVEMDSEADLKFPRAGALVNAIQQQRDYKIITLVRVTGQNSPEYEGIIIDVESDEVPPINPYGILYCERILLMVPEDETKLPDAFALRKDFPILIHQNQVGPGLPASLCLYFDPTATVRRTWTPQSFLRRIQWWLMKTARNELHPVDQPVEQLFLNSKHELILPWNLDNNSAKTEQNLIIYAKPKRNDGGMSFFVEIVLEGIKPEIQTVAHLDITLEPIVHGQIERDSSNLGELADTLQQRGVDLLGPIKETLHQRIGKNGAALNDDEEFCIVLLRIPVCRMNGQPPERIIYKSFMISGGVFRLGEATGAYALNNGRYYNFKLLNSQKGCNKWRDIPVEPMEVLHRNGRTEARKQSGISEDGPHGVLVGVGSLGSAIINFWGRSGWGQWSIIDNDHIKPHNLSRHTALSNHIGLMKTNAVAELNFMATHGANKISSFAKDACDLADEDIERVLKTSSLIVDASTTLEYPRLVSTLDDVGRHISVFITPNGNAAVLLAEDENREIRLRTLEAQYYRAVIENEWGKSHLEGDLGSFWSGTSCRDISMVLPYSRIMNHASTLTEQIQEVSNHSQAMIRIWERDPAIGSVSAHNIPVFSEVSLVFGADLTLYIDRGIEANLKEMRISHLPNETGGILLGYYDFNVNAVVVVDALPAPLDSKSSPQAFERGIADLEEAVHKAGSRTANIVGYIGEWHSHPPGHSASPSRNDLIQLAHLADGMAEDGLPAIQLIIGDNDIQIHGSAVI